MNILVLPSFYPNSYNPVHGIFFRDHALALKAAGHRVIVLAVVPISLKDVWKKRKCAFGFTRQDDAGITTYLYVFPSIPKLRCVNNLIRTLIGWHLYRIIRQQHGYPNLVHVHGFLAGGLALKIKRQDAVQYAITEHSTAFARGILSRSEQKLASIVFKEAIVRTAVSMQFGQLLADRYGVSFLYTANPVGFRDMVTNMDRHAMKTNGQRIRICNVAYLDPNKRQDRLVHAFNSVVCVFPNTELHIAGDGPERARLEELVSELGLESQVVFHGLLQRPEVFKLMCSCHVFALSSDFETFGVVLVEAMYCGLPVIATRCGGPESIITEEWLGLLTRTDDESFAQGLLSIMKGVHENLFDSCRISAHAKATYSYEAIGKRMTDILFPSK
jgi:L-malate glycosyltransferase